LTQDPPALARVAAFLNWRQRWIGQLHARLHVLQASGSRGEWRG
jgi:hypothetical protein